MQNLQQILSQFDKKVWVSGSIVVALLAYAVGAKFLLLPVFVALSVVYLPLPRLLSSIFARLVVSFLLSFSLLQVAGTLQFLVFPKSGFVVLATIASALQLLILLYVPERTDKKAPFLSRSDIAGLITAAFFLVPFTPLLGGEVAQKIAGIGSIQAIDATNHYAGIAEMNTAEHLNYRPNYYYPKGFHLAAAFAENTVFSNQYSLGWQGNAMLYFAQYMVMALTLGYVALYVALGMLRILKVRVVSWSSHFLLALCLGPSFALFYLVPFVTQGFLNYYYVALTVFAGFLFLMDRWHGGKEAKETAQEWQESFTNPRLRWALLAYLLLLFGASVSWPLLIPPLALIGVMVILPANWNIWALVKKLISWQGLPLLAAFILQLVPIYFQLKYTNADGSQGINLTGSLRTFHGLLLLAGAGIVTGFLFARGNDAYKHLLWLLCMPLVAFVGLLVLIQYFTVGEIRYYGIKSSLLLEMLFLIIGVVGLIYIHAKHGVQAAKYAFLLPVIPVFSILLLLSVHPNPLKDVRDLLRNYSNELKPLYFDHDKNTYAQLGSEGKIKHFNSTILHYDHHKQKFFAHSQAAFWGNMMQYDASHADFLALHCDGALYSNLAFGSYTNAEQQALVRKVKSCAQMSKDRGEQYYIVTDADSAPMIEKTFGPLVTIRY